MLELGAGMGVCGLIAHKTGASSVVLTDGDITTLRYIRQVGRGIVLKVLGKTIED